MINEVNLTSPKSNSTFGIPESVTREQLEAACEAPGLDPKFVISMRVGLRAIEVETINSTLGARVYATIPVVSK